MDSNDHGHRHPRITKAYAKSLIAQERIIVDSELSIVVCMVKLKNEQRFIGDAIVANRETFDAEKGTKIARDKVIDQIMRSEMYLLRTKLHETKNMGGH